MPRRTRPDSRPLVPVLLALLLACGGPVFAAPPDLGALRKDLVGAVRAKDPNAVRTALHALMQEGSATAAEIIIEDGLLCDRPELEVEVREMLSQMPPGPGFTWLCTRCNDHEKVEVRDQLVRVLTHRSEKEAFTAVLTALYDPSDAVKVTAVRAVDEKDHRGAIPHLIRALAYQEERERELGQIANEIRRVLIRWTGKDLFGSGEYERLWKSHRDELLDPSNKGKEDPLGEVEWEKRGTGVYARVPRFFNMEILSQRVVFVMDTSISMKEEDPPPPVAETPENDDPDEGSGGTSVGGDGGRKSGGRRGDAHRGPRQRLKRVQNELVRLISDLPEEFEFTIVSFDQEVSLFSKGLQPASSKNKSQAIRFVRGFECDGETWTDDALEAAFDVPRARTIVLLSDGQPYRQKKKIDVPALLEWVKDKNRFEHRTISTIGFAATSGSAGSFLQRLAYDNGGEYREIP